LEFDLLGFAIKKPLPVRDFDSNKSPWQNNIDSINS